MTSERDGETDDEGALMESKAGNDDSAASLLSSFKHDIKSQRSQLR